MPNGYVSSSKGHFSDLSMPNTQYTHKYTNEKCLKNPSCAIFLKSMGVKDIKYDIPM